MPSLVQAAKDTSTVCQQAFRHRRWNCSSIERAPHYTPELLTGPREKESHAEDPQPGSSAFLKAAREFGGFADVIGSRAGPLHYHRLPN